jgi:hypothetical protein
VRLPSSFCSALTAVVKAKSTPSMVPLAMIDAWASIMAVRSPWFRSAWNVLRPTLRTAHPRA